MIIIRVELVYKRGEDFHSRELARMGISNTGEPDNAALHNYIAEVYRGRDSKALGKFTVLKSTKIRKWPRDRVHIWNLVAHALKRMGYGKVKKKSKVKTG